MATVASASTAVAITEKGAPLTAAQSLLLSQALLKDGQSGGSDVTVVVPFGAAATFTMTGTVDWVGHGGNVMMTTKRSDGVAQPPQQLLWSAGTLYLPLPGLSEEMKAKGRDGVTWVSRPINPRSAVVDQVLTLLNSLASDRAENPILLRQGDTGFLGQEAIRGRLHQRFRFGRSTYFIDPGGRIGRFVATFRSVSGPIVVDVAAFGARPVAVPPAASVVAAADIADIYARLSKGAG